MCHLLYLNICYAFPRISTQNFKRLWFHAFKYLYIYHWQDSLRNTRILTIFCFIFSLIICAAWRATRIEVHEAPRKNFKVTSYNWTQGFLFGVFHETYFFSYFDFTPVLKVDELKSAVIFRICQTISNTLPFWTQKK